MKLTQQQRAQLFSGEFPKLAYPGAESCPVKLGDTYHLALDWWIEIVDIKRSKKGDHVARYHVHDMRTKPRLLAIQNGRRNAGQYVSSRGQALPDEPEAVDAAWQTRHSETARKRDDELMAEERRMRDARSTAAKLKDTAGRLKARGVDIEPSLARIDAEIEAMRRDLDEAA